MVPFHYILMPSPMYVLWLDSRVLRGSLSWFVPSRFLRRSRYVPVLVLYLLYVQLAAMGTRPLGIHVHTDARVARPSSVYITFSITITCFCFLFATVTRYLSPASRYPLPATATPSLHDVYVFR